MSHEIDTAAFSVTKAWHGLGNVFPRLMTVDEAREQSGLTWEVEESEMLTGTFCGDKTDTTEYKMRRRSDTGAVLAVVSDSYTGVANRTLFEIGESLARESPESVRVESAASLRGGRRVFVCVRGETLDIGPAGDRHVPYLLIANSHDGSMSLRIVPTWVRVVCANTMAAALCDRGGWTWSHTSGIEQRISDIRAALRRWNTDTEKTRTAMDTLAQTRLTREQVLDLWVEAIQHCDGAIPEAHEARVDKVAARRRERAVQTLAYMARVFEADQQRGLGANALVAMNAATNWIEHVRGRHEKSARVNSNLFGHYANLKKHVFRRTLALVQAV